MVLGGEGCLLCQHGSEAMRRNTVAEFEQEIGPFEPVVFWSLIAAKPEYVLAEHFESQRTNHHYLFRIDFTPLLRDHAHGLAVRLRNMLVPSLLRRQWIKRLVCPDDHEAVVLARALAGALELADSSVVAIPRDKVLRLVTGQVLTQDVIDALKSRGIDTALAKENVILIDQAVHHMGTLGAIDAICAHSAATVLASGVALDRAGSSKDLSKYFSHARYVSLYSWPSPPKLRSECPCRPIVQ